MKKIISMVIVFALISGAITNTYSSELKLYAKAVILMEAKSGKTLYKKSEQVKMANASTTKILTCYYVITHCKLDEVVTISQNAASQPRVRLGVRKGETYKVEDLLYGLMLESYNDCAVALAEHVSGSVEGFASDINKEAKKMGAKNTHFVTPNGLDGSDKGGSHGTTAYDLAKIMSQCIKNKTFLNITRKKSHSFHDLKGQRTFQCNNHNTLLNSMEGAISGKTGFTTKAGYCYVGAINKEGMDLIAVVLGCGWPPHKSYKWSDVKTLVTYASNTYEYKEILADTKDIKSISVKEGLKKQAQLKVPDKKIKVLAKKTDKVELKLYMPKSVYAPCEVGQVIGNISYYVDGKKVGKTNILANEDVRKKDYWWYLKIAIEKFCV